MGDVPVRTGRKVSFCLEDEKLDDVSWGKQGVRPRYYRAPDCLELVASDDKFNYLIQGLTAGWADVYEWNLPGQYLEVTGVPDGYYVLETIADPDDKIVEGDESNNCGTVLIKLTHMGTPRRTADIVGPGPRCALNRRSSN